MKRIKKLLLEKFKDKQFEGIEINLYKLKNELIRNRDGSVYLNISHPFKEDNVEKIIKTKLNINN